MTPAKYGTALSASPAWLRVSYLYSMHTKAASLCICSSKVAQRTWIALERAISLLGCIPALYQTIKI